MRDCISWLLPQAESFLWTDLYPNYKGIEKCYWQEMIFSNKQFQAYSYITRTANSIFHLRMEKCIQTRYEIVQISNILPINCNVDIKCVCNIRIIFLIPVKSHRLYNCIPKCSRVGLNVTLSIWWSWKSNPIQLGNI